MIFQSLFQTGIFLQVVTSGRLESIIAGIVALISILIARLVAPRYGQPAAIVALVLALTGIALSVLRLVRATGGFGTGSGKLGAIIALVLALIGVVLSWRALARTRRTG